MNNSLPENYEDKLARLNENDFFRFFDKMNAEPRPVNSAGKPSIQILGLCHHGDHHSAVFDPSTGKVTCFAACGCGMLLHNWVKRACDLDSPQEAKDLIEEWMDGQDIDFASRDPQNTEITENIREKKYEERTYEPEHIEPLPGIPPEIVKELYAEFDTSFETLDRLKWHTREGIATEMMQLYQVAYFPKRKTIILPHHNINGEIVGLYERSYLDLRRDVKKEMPDAPYWFLMQFPRAKYVPLLKDERFRKEDDEKTSWSFSNILNLYGLHLAKDSIRETGKAIIFEGGKSVMLARQYGYPFAVASHTFGANVNHISMLIEQGAKEIILAFDKQYQNVDDFDKEWTLYEKRTREFARKIGKYVNVSRITDLEDEPKLDYKDAPIDKGKEIFDELYSRREMLIIDGEEQPSRRDKEKVDPIPPEQREKDWKEMCPDGWLGGSAECDAYSTPEPQFRGLPIRWVHEPKYEKCAFDDGKEKVGTAHLIEWNSGKYGCSDFLKTAFPEQYNKVKKTVALVGRAADNVMRLTTAKRKELAYACLAYKYPLVEVDPVDSGALKRLCQEDLFHNGNNSTVRDLQTWLNWSNGLAKLVTFGTGKGIQGAAQYTWCYQEEYRNTEAVFEGVEKTWENWSIELKKVLDLYRRDDYHTIWEHFRPALYYQKGCRLTLTGEDRTIINSWFYAYLNDETTPFPLQGEIPGAAYSFTIDYEKDVEYIDSKNLNEPGEMAAYNAEHNKENNVKKGISRVQKRFSSVCGDHKVGDQLTTQELKDMGYTDPNAITRLVNDGVLSHIRRGVYAINSV